MLLFLTVVTGIVDSISYVLLGHVFVANMTGNVVFVGFAAAGVNISLIGTLISLACFVVGVVIGGKLATRYVKRRFALLHRATMIMLVPLVVALVLCVLWGSQLHTHSQYLLVALLALAMGIQGAAARAIAVADLTTLVLTMTLTSLVADASKNLRSVDNVRRLLSILAMLLGAAVGTVFTVNQNSIVPMVIVTGLVALVSLLSYRRRAVN
jgi:uncharacterized membrane protein YoaK (UPF0700 family)